MASKLYLAAFVAALTTTPALAGEEPFGMGFDGWKFTQEDTSEGALCRAYLGSNVIARYAHGSMYLSMPAGRVPQGSYPESHLEIGGAAEPVDAKSNGKRFWLISDEGFLNGLAAARGYFWRTGPIKGKFVEGRVAFNTSTGKALKELRACTRANGGF